MSNRTKGGKKRNLTNLQSRRQQFDAQKDTSGCKRPGSNKK